MFTIKIYKYDSTKDGYRGEDFSRFLSQGQDVTEDITQILDTSEITLFGLTTKTAFEPETKFIVDILENGTIVETIHRCVSRDIVNQPVLSDETYFDHHISMIEPSVVAQKRLVDNIASTYKLKDVSLKEVPAFPDTTATFDFVKKTFTPAKKFGNYKEEIPHIGTLSDEAIYNVSGKYFVVVDEPKIINNGGETFETIYNNIEKFKNDEGTYSARFAIPKILIFCGINHEKEFTSVGYASVDYTIREYPLNSETISRQWTGAIISNSFLRPYAIIVPERDILNGEWIIEQTTAFGDGGTAEPFAYKYYKKYTDTSAPAPSYISQSIDIKKDCRYEVSFSLHQFDDNVPSDNSFVKKFTGAQPSYYQEYYYVFSSIAGGFSKPFVTNSYMTAQNTSGKASFVTYGIDTKEIVYSSSTPYSALALLQKAIVNSGIYEKKDGFYIADVNNSPIPFYIDDNFRDELSATAIIENFYNQKNLWEIMVEVGNYIHAIPELVFGTDDRFMITFNRLGRTDEQHKDGTKVSLFNSRSVEDYISATSSYITNMVQLGGYVEEWVSPKTTHEQLLVSNDTAQIIVSKPIIELLDIKVRRNSDGAIADLTEYIYEENVYKTLSIDYTVIPNRGIALYYKLGTNIITGGDYQLPQANTNIYTDYAIKKAIYSAFSGYPVLAPAPQSGCWTNYKVNDYSFFVRYRTKDSVRQNHIRPDLRKYLLNSKWDRYPEHNQFNNQTDVVIDSIKFGNQMYGKLIRTGNNTYEKSEWNDGWDNIKHKGELYRIDGELYYVAKVTHTIYHSCIISRITFSKDYNELSNIIGIPSEPRFYEISEQSLIWREFAINDLLLLTDDETQLAYNGNYVLDYNHLASLIAGVGTDFAKYAVTVFKGDKDTGGYDQTVGQSDLYLEVINPINAYSSETTLTYEYDMEDNYSAGNKVIATEQISNETPSKGSYNSLWAVKYTDIYGRASLMDFYILGSIGTPTPAEIMAFPECPITTKDNSASNFIGKQDVLATNVRAFDTNFNGRGIGLLKDCREAISVNYNLQMITNSDTFVLSPYVYLPKKSNLRLVLLSEEVNKLSTGYVDNSVIIPPMGKDGTQLDKYFTYAIDKSATATNPLNGNKTVVTKFGIDLETVFANVSDNHFTNTEGYQRVKAIALLCDVALNPDEGAESPSLPYKTQFVIARNIPEHFTRAQALKKWVWGAPNKDAIFKRKQ
jgi:hypothetical protein